MPTVTLTLPDDVRFELGYFSWVNWSEVARQEFKRMEKVAEAFEKVEKIISKSKLTERDAEAISRKISVSMAKKFREI